MIKIILLLLLVFSPALFSCSQKANEVQFSQALHYDTTLRSYEFIIQNISDRNLLIFVPGTYVKIEGRAGDQYIMDATFEIFSERYFTPLNVEDFDQTALASVLLSKTDPKYQETFKLFTKPNQDFPGLLFIKSHSTIQYRYNCIKNLCVGKYTITYNVPEFIAKSKKMKEWKNELRRIKKIENYFYIDANVPYNKGISFEIK